MSKVTKSLRRLHGRVRDYERENKYKATPFAIAVRVANNRARRRAIAEGRAKVGDGTVVHHQGHSLKSREGAGRVISRTSHDKITGKEQKGRKKHRLRK